jgi:DNA-binding response OmpR family regulator
MWYPGIAPSWHRRKPELGSFSADLASEEEEGEEEEEEKERTLRILLVEDYERLASLVRQGLQRAEMDVDSVTTASEALEVLFSHRYDAMILDLGLPDRDGLDVLKFLRSNNSSLPVLILTSRVQVSDRVKGLNAGADDYLTKPFAMEELVARLHALLRRPQPSLGQVLAAGDVYFDVIAREARVGTAPLPVSPREARVLEQLLRRSGKVVPKSIMEQGLYGIDEELSSNTVEVLIHRLRKKLTDSHAQVAIHTVRGVGYMIMAENR